MTCTVSTPHLDELNNAIRALMKENIASALEIVQGILAQDPDVPEALHLLGLCAVRLSDLGRGIALIMRAHEIDPECRDYADALSVLKTQMGDLDDSLYFAKLATTLEVHPKLENLTPSNLQNYAAALDNINVSSFHLEAMVGFELRRFDEAVALCEKELRLTPDSPKTLLLMGQSLIEIGEYPRAQAALQAVEHLFPGDPDVAIALAHSLLFQGNSDDTLACLQYAMASDEERIDGVCAYLTTLSFMDDARWTMRKELDETLLARAKAMGVEAMEGSDQPAEGKIRIGILADIFYRCDDALVLEAFLTTYNRERFEVFCYQQSATHDNTTDHLKSLCDSWRPVFNLDDYVVASIISGDAIQALIDLTGFGPGQRRAVLAAQAAPLQVAWFNHLDGTGKGCINLLLTDRATLETDRRTRLEGQEIAELETGLYAFAPFAMLGEPGPLPALEHNTITFGARADLARLSAQTALMWCTLLRGVPKSLLALNTGPNLPEDIRMSLVARFAHFGLTGRIVFFESEQQDGTYEDPELTFLKGVDILLDGGVNTTAAHVARALWMGVPVLTRDGGRRSAQVAASVLHSAGKGEWVASTSTQLVETACTLTKDFATLDTIRQSLRKDVEDSNLFKGRAFAREIETALEIALEDKGI